MATTPFLRGYLQRRLPAEMLAEIEPSLTELGELAGGELYRLQLQDRLERADAHAVGCLGQSRRSHRSVAAVASSR